jgi:hypothetical protein
MCSRAAPKKSEASRGSKWAWATGNRNSKYFHPTSTGTPGLKKENFLRETSPSQLLSHSYYFDSLPKTKGDRSRP